nr:uncharacterized protein LOC124817350 isoform X4 [Hydra vulgaris]
MSDKLMYANFDTSTPVSNPTSAMETKHILATYADVCAKIKEHELLHTVGYVVGFTRSMEKSFEEILKANHRVFFEDKDVSYTGVPFIVSSNGTLDCHHGKDKNSKAKALYKIKKNTEASSDHSFKKKRMIPQITKKFDCPAKIFIKEIIEFPEFKLDRDSTRIRKEVSKKLHSALILKQTVLMCRKYILVIPAISAHSNHLIGDASGLNQPLCEELILKIGELVRTGVSSVTEMRRHLKTFLQMEFNSNNMLQKTNKRFFPSDKTIANHMLIARRKLRKSMIDQECLWEKINDWKINFQDAMIKFRPKGGNSEDNDLKNSLLFVYQDIWQRRLLLRYGNELAFLDATYRTTRYALPLFFLVVKTNINYQIVAIFVCEHETTESIKEALMCIKEWNPLFQPKFFITDYSNEEINSLESVFSGSTVFICDFHREQAWERWLSKTANGCCMVKDVVKDKLREIAHAKTIETCQKAVEALEESKEWQNNPKLVEYLKSTWLCIQKRWVVAYRKDRILLDVNTNNGTERQNLSFKYSFLEKRKNSSLTTMLSICIEEFLPHKYDNYCDENRRAHSSHRKYDDKVPAYLIDRPPSLVKHCMALIDKLQGVDLRGITAVTDKLYNVASFNSNSREIYQCYLGDSECLPACSCPSWFRTSYPCKHFLAIFLKENLSWSAFGTAYANSPYFKLDLFLDENSLAHSNKVSLYNIQYEHVEPLHISSLIKHSDKEVQNFNYVHVNSSQSLIAKNYSNHTSASCRELLNEIKQMSYLCDSQQAIDNLFEGLCQLKTHLAESLPVEQGILLRPEIQPDTWNKSHTNSPKLSLLPVRRKRKMTKRVGVKYDKYKAAANISVMAEKESYSSEIVTSHSIDENYEIFMVPNESIDIMEHLTDDSNNSVDMTVNEDVKQDRIVLQIQSLKSSLIGHKEQNDIIKGHMLNDNVIHFCQQLMAIQLNIDVGLQDPIKGQILSFDIYTSTPFVQILHDGNLHWLCVTTYDCKPGEIYVFDSLFHGTISLETKRQICNILHCQEKNLVFKVLPVQQQTNGVDCGIYAIAWARQILETKSLPSTNLMFEESEIRSHLLKCISNNQIEIFPATKNPFSFRRCAAKTFRVPLHCSCRMFWVPGDEDIYNRQMAQCCACSRWFHRECEKIPLSAYEQEDEIWNCNDCHNQSNK